jgi:hypothetical protein
MNRRHKISIAVKLVYSAFVVVLVPHYWVTYSPWILYLPTHLALRTWFPQCVEAGEETKSDNDAHSPG